MQKRYPFSCRGPFGRQPAVHRPQREEMQSAGLRGPQALDSGGPQLTLRSAATSAGCDLKTFPLRRLRLFEPHSSPTPHAADCNPRHESYTRHSTFFFLKKKNELNPYRQSPVCDANPRPTVRWHDVSITHASAPPAAEAISDRGRPRRRSVKNRKSFDCFKSAAGIRFSAGAVADPEIVSPRRFLTALRLFSSFAPRQFMQA